MRFWVLALVLSATVGAQSETFAGSTRADRASDLFDSARRRLARGSHEQRQFALTELQDAHALDPARIDIGLLLGRLYLEADLLRPARDVARRLIATDSSAAEAWRLAGEVWRRYWLVTVEESSRDRAIACLAHSGRLASRDSKTWLLLAPLLVDAGEFDAASSVAACAVRAAPGDAEAVVSLAAAAQRIGDLKTAERLFEWGVPRLPPVERERYDDILPLLPPRTAAEYDGLDPGARARFAQHFWAETDPDPVSVENEARLEYWARVTQALLLYGSSRPGEWDKRALYYVRFGRPGMEELEPIFKPSSLRDGHWLAWTYPDLGLRVWMGTPSIHHGFPAYVTGYDLMARAAPDSLARHRDLLAVNGGWAVLHRQPPGVTPLEAGLALARFQAETGASLFAQVEAPGEIGDQLTAEWVLFDSTDAPVLRGRQLMSASACRTTEARAASFTAPLAPGRYSVGVQVADSLGHRGSVRRRVVAGPVARDLALSDLVVVCGSPAQSVVAGSGVRLEPETDLFPAEGERLNAYFEIYNLARPGGGEARFTYDCVVRPVIRDRRGWLSRMLMPLDVPALIQVSRTETTPDRLRRQFMAVQVGSLPSGRYEISVLVRDETTGATARTATTFERRQ